MHPRRDAEPAHEALHQLRLARAQVAGQADDQSGVAPRDPSAHQATRFPPGLCEMNVSHGL